MIMMVDVMMADINKRRRVGFMTISAGFMVDLCLIIGGLWVHDGSLNHR